MQKELQIPLVPVKISTLSYKALCVFKKKTKKHSSTGKSSYQSLYPILLLHLLPQLLKACLHAVVERPERLCDLLSVDTNTFGEMWNLVEENSSVRHLHQTGMERWETSTASLLRLEERISICHKFNFTHMSFGPLGPLWMCTFSTGSKCISLILHMHCKAYTGGSRMSQKAVAMTLPLLSWHHRHRHNI